MEVIVLHHNCVENCFDVRERIVLSRTNNMETMWWQIKGYETSIGAPAHLLKT